MWPREARAEPRQARRRRGSRAKDGQTPLHSASSRGLVELSRFLVEHTGDAAAQGNRAQGRPDTTAFGVLQGLRGTRTVLRRAQDENVWTPLHLASLGGHVELALFLLERSTPPTRQPELTTGRYRCIQHFQTVMWISRGSSPITASKLYRIPNLTLEYVLSPSDLRTRTCYLWGLPCMSINVLD
jgi:ankyrin repeat protein